MEHESNTSGAFAELPQPQELGGAAAENQPASEPEAPANQPPATLPKQTQSMTDPMVMSVDSAAVPTPSQATDDQTTLIADDADLIEKEWVTKAKAIVAQTKDDPHNQNREMTKVKADYLKKRYNKDLKISEG